MYTVCLLAPDTVLQPTTPCRRVRTLPTARIRHELFCCLLGITVIVVLDKILLAIWLLGSILVGLLTLALVRLSDSRNHQVVRVGGGVGQAALNLAVPPPSSLSGGPLPPLPPQPPSQASRPLRVGGGWWRGLVGGRRARRTRDPGEVTPFATSAAYEERSILSPPESPREAPLGAAWLPQPFPAARPTPGAPGRERRALDR